LDAALSRKITERLLPVFKITSDAAAVDPDFAELNRAMTARRRAEMIDAATLLAGDDGLRLSPDDAAASPLVLYSPHVAQILTEHLGWSYDATRLGSLTPSSDSSSTTRRGCLSVRASQRTRTP
jgi:hypothetical protein